ncbi:MAG TPA: M23 family metallopeptidase [Vicinamibacterales bacterium]|nr:M23 family metallopeptidase [Vicinamibacterales bacterium]
MRKALLLVIGLTAGACGPLDTLRHAVLRTPPYEIYVETLRDAGLESTTLGAAWLDAGQRALADARETRIASRGVERFRHDTPTALAYRVELRRGQVYRLALDPDDRWGANVFIDVFRVVDGQAPLRVASAGPPVRHFAFEPDEDETFIIRVQPLLLEEGSMRVAHARRAALLFPVPGYGRRNVQSLFGASRSNGAREHQGIDIFAPRGTPVVASADGWISSTSPNTLGGNVVWLWDSARGHTLYYAHLDRHAVERGQRVRKGDVLGYVGNTGNARTTAPHLHFGIYRRGRGAIDPLYYVVDPPW